MIKISKNEKDYLLENGCRWHEDITAPVTRRHYYAIESNDVKELLRKYREATLVNTLTPSVP